MNRMNNVDKGKNDKQQQQPSLIPLNGKTIYHGKKSWTPL